MPAKEVVAGAIKLAESILESSPDAIRSTKRAINESTLHGNVEDAYRMHIISTENQAVFSGENIKACVHFIVYSPLNVMNSFFVVPQEGLKAFAGVCRVQCTNVYNAFTLFLFDSAGDRIGRLPNYDYDLAIGSI